MRDMVWITARGQAIPVRQMGTSHIMNCIRLIERRGNWRRHYLDRFRSELIVRELGGRLK